MPFEVLADETSASSGANSLLISQFALPGDVAQAICAAERLYAASVANLTSGMAFADNMAEQAATQTLVLAGDAVTDFIGIATIGIVV